jgi:hypothetical protein
MKLAYIIGGLNMKFEGTDITGKEVEFSIAEHVLGEAGFVHAGQWDYERVTFDYKFDDQVNEDVYYLRVQAYAVKGEIPSPYSVIKFLDPILGKHYYPHGVEYSDETFPKHILDKCNKKLEHISTLLK